tara:strand:- start:13262 stop:13480 length:219 start_codon:yes stop_codon:yes gene_type:complete
MLFKNQHLMCEYPYFTAVQAAQKLICVGLSPALFFTAVQAAQKYAPSFGITTVGFTAVQAAQKPRIAERRSL